MRAAPFFLIFFLSLIPSFSWAADFIKTIPDRPKIGLALGGGGAKGFAHIGVLKVLEANDIPIDMIAGTSIGAVAGGFYAMGMDADEIDRMADTIDWLRLFGIGYENEKFFELTNQITYKIPFYFQKDEDILLHEGGVVSGDKILLFLRGKTAGMSFSQLRIPFKATSVDLLSGDLKILDHGEVALAMRSSFSIPGIFAPVNTEGMLLVDGGILDNLPVDVVRSMGADIVIAVDLSSFEPKKKEDMSNVLAVIERFETIQHQAINAASAKKADLVIHPDVISIGLLEFNKQKEARKAGEAAASLKIEELKKMIGSYSVNNRTFKSGLSKSPE